MAAAAECKQIGTHEVRLEDDLVFLIQRGDYTLGDATRINEEIGAVLSRYGRVFVLVDQSQAGRTPPEARRALAEWNKKHRCSGAAIFGSSGAARAVATLVITAIRLFRPDAMPTIFANSEAEARAWIENRRAHLPPEPRPARPVKK
jgi:hypothetical protein